MAGILIRKRGSHKEDRDWSGEATRQGMPRMTGNYQNLGKDKGVFSSISFRGT
jgi:hypothetical protein